MRLAWISALLAANSAIALAEINWSPDLRSAHEQAKAQGKLLLVHFECDNCQYCEQLEAGAFQRPEVSSAIAQSYIPVKVNASRNRKLAEYFGVGRRRDEQRCKGGNAKAFEQVHVASSGEIETRVCDVVIVLPPDLGRVP